VRAIIVLDLGFGDAGKGLVTDFLVRRCGVRLVVRYSGGAQAGHNVVAPDGRHHTFSQFGAGTLVPGVRTFLSKHVVVHPTALLVEEATLNSIGVTDAFERINVSEQALVVTPYHQAAARLRELARGIARHGSCGVGVGETVNHAITKPDESIRAGDLRNRSVLRRKLERIREREHSQVIELVRVLAASGQAKAEMVAFERSDTSGRWIALATQIAGLVRDDSSWATTATAHSTVVFEGAQGVLLDEKFGFHPYTTWSCCTNAPALEMLTQAAPGAELLQIGVLRAYAVRHGPGPFPTEAMELAGVPFDHNKTNVWQGAVRRGWFDAVLARYALDIAGSVDTLAITHLDWLPKLKEWTHCTAYDPGVPLRPSFADSLERQAELGELLASTRPVLSRCPATEESVLDRIESLVSKPVMIGSRGPSAPQVFIRPDAGFGLRL